MHDAELKPYCVLDWRGEAGRNLSYLLRYKGHEWKPFQHACALYYSCCSFYFLVVGTYVVLYLNRINEYKRIVLKHAIMLLLLMSLSDF
jgi:hypothetical protein